MSDTTDFANAFKELVRVVQPDNEPKLTYGNGSTPDLTAELDQILENHKRAKTFVVNATYEVGNEVMPITRNGYRYIVTVRGVAGAEPTWPTTQQSSVVSGTVTFEEAGSQYENIYDLRSAKYEGCLLKTRKAAGRNHYLNDGRAEGSDYTYLNWRREAERYRPIGVA